MTSNFKEEFDLVFATLQKAVLKKRESREGELVVLRKKDGESVKGTVHLKIKNTRAVRPSGSFRCELQSFVLL